MTTTRFPLFLAKCAAKLHARVVLPTPPLVVEERDRCHNPAPLMTSEQKRAYCDRTTSRQGRRAGCPPERRPRASSSFGGSTPAPCYRHSEDARRATEHRPGSGRCLVATAVEVLGEQADEPRQRLAGPVLGP